jgi:hypothetical protein
MERRKRLRAARDSGSRASEYARRAAAAARRTSAERANHKISGFVRSTLV